MKSILGRITLLAFLTLAFTLGAAAQTTLISPTGDGGFETGTTFAANGWTVVNDATNKWEVGTATINAGLRGAYVSNNAGVANAYTTTVSDTSHFYRDIAFPAGETAITLSFSWKGQGEGSFDRLLVYTAPTSVTPAAGTPISSSTTLTGATLVAGPLNLQAAYTTTTITLPAAFAGTTQRIIFTWQDDTSGGTQPPAGIDNISLVSVTPTPISGTKTVCPTGCDFATLTAANTFLNTNGVNGALTLELQSTYVSTSETLPITFGNIAGNSSTNTITVRPATGATGLSIAGSSATTVIDLNGAQNVIIDGRLGGTGTTKDLTISNTNTSGAAIRFINDASNNRIQYNIIRGVETSTTSGVIFFSTTTGTTGNDGNTIDNNDIRDGATTPNNGIYASGTTTTTATNNSGNTISNNNIFNFFNAGSSENGILVSGGNTDWTITGNSLYQTIARTETAAATESGITISNSSSGNNFVITNNFIGGGAANAGGTAWNIGGSVANRFRGISLSVGSTTASSVQGNTIANFIFLSTSGATTLGGPWTGIYLTAGNANIGTTTGNTIGSGTGTGSITATISTTGGVSSGIFCDAASTVSSISNNIIGSVATGSTTTLSHGFVGISTTAGTTLTINNNTIGSTATANSINAAASTNTTGQVVTGISNTSSATIAITNNTIANLNNAYVPSAAGVTVRVLGGINSTGGTNTITGNTIRNLTTAANVVGTGSNASVQGIQFTGTLAPLTISNNTIFALANNNATNVVLVSGIYNNGPTSGTNTIARNYIHSLTTASTAGIIHGINIGGGTSTYQNNMIALGNGLTTSAQINGINEPIAGTDNFYHNSVYIGGTGVVSGTVNTFAFNSSVITNVRNYRDNIFFNARSNTSGTGAHYGIQVGGTAANPTGLTSNNNVIFANGTGGVFGRFNNANVADIAAWRMLTGQDANSFESNPQYNDPTNAAPDLHLHPTNLTVAEGNGFNVGVTDDFDGQTRSGLTPTDIGADAGNFNGQDATAPVITYNALTNTGSTTNRILSVTITDNTGVDTTGGNDPRIYFNKNNGTYVSTACSLASGTAQNGTYNCTIDNSLVGGVALNDVIRYYVVAQDTLGNLAANPSAGFVGSNVNTVTTPPTTPNQYTILAGFGGVGNPSRTVCASGCDYTSLTGVAPGGIFAALNAGVLGGNFTILVSGSVTETGATALNQQIEEGVGAGTFILTVKPSATANLSGTNATALININGADRFVIDGSIAVNGTSKDLTIFNNGAGAGAAVLFANGAVGNTLKNTILMCNGTTNATSIVVFGTTTLANGGNNNNTVQNNTMTSGSTFPLNGVYLLGSSAVNSTGNIITGNSITNFFQAGVYHDQYYVNTTVSKNTIFETATITPTSLYGVYINHAPGGNFTQNTIRDLNTGGTTPTIRGFFYNAGASGDVTSITNNFVTLDATTTTAGATIYGFDNFANSGTITNFYFNSVRIGGTGITGTATSAAVYKRFSNTLDLRDNILANFRSNGTGTGRHYALNVSSAGNLTNLTSNYNDLFANGTGFAIATLDGGTTNFTTLATYQAAAGGRDANSVSADPLFVSATDLHLTGASTLLTVGNATGTSVTVDFDSDTRDTVPDIGADEVVQGTGGTLNGGTYYNASPAAGTTLGGDVTVTNSLTLNGILSTGVNTLTLDCGVTNANVTGAGASSFVVGNVQKNFCGSGAVNIPFSFPVGDNTGTPEYSPLDATVTNIGINPSSLTVSAVDAYLPTLDAGISLSRYWNLTEGGDLTTDLTFRYQAADVNGNEAQYRVYKRVTGNAVTPCNLTSVCTAGTNQISITNVSDFSQWGAGQAQTTAASAELAGRVLDADGKGLPRAMVIITDSNGATLTTTTNPFGYYSFSELPSGAGYTINVSSKQYVFAPRVINLTSSVNDFDIVAQP